MSKQRQLTDEQVAVIERLNDRLYTAENMRDWYESDSANVFINAPLALQQAIATGYLRAVDRIIEQEEE